MKILFLILLSLLLTGCSSEADMPAPTSEETIPIETTLAEPTEPDPIELMISAMTTEEKVGQLFLARCNAATAIEDIEAYQFAGFVLFGVDFKDRTADQLFNTVASYQFTTKIPMLIAVDEEGGTVTRVSRYRQYRDQPFPSPRSLYKSGGMEAVLLCEKEKCTLLRELGINVNLAPVCDITTDPDAFMYDRSLGQSPEITAEFISGAVRQMRSSRVGSVLKHFPGYGNNADTHTGIAVDDRALEALECRDLIPFAAGIEAGCGGILVSHTIVNCLDPDLPASLSPAVRHYLRQEMGFDGVIITDDLVMQAITDTYGAGEAAVLAVLAGNDLLCSSEYAIQYEAVLAAVQEGRISHELVDAAVRRVLTWKQALGLLG